ncbi:replication-relaxation family protein [Ruminococcaceae bacterium OttesenSCG-928-A11]|nr:replication-relaxation family protein [Ruminococcaceae bacterium OttesenSCG-928-A11]
MATPANLRSNLSEFELSVLHAISVHKVILAAQILEICNASSLRKVQRLLVELEQKRLVISRPYKQTGNPNAWAITKLGLKVAHRNSDKLSIKLKQWTPRVGAHTAGHILAINDTEVVLKQLEKSQEHDFRVELVQHEPECWRRFNDDVRDGVWLKPDMYVETSRLENGKRYRFKWFLEVDLDTERPHRVLSKCEVYVNYWRNEKPATLPLIVWVVPDEIRKNSLQPKIIDKFDKLARFFKVITVDELPDLMTKWLPNQGESGDKL